jgi:hypothetical protein
LLHHRSENIAAPIHVLPLREGQSRAQKSSSPLNRSCRAPAGRLAASTGRPVSRLESP